ncbi:response regulator transcription factor [Elusimicrobiota bacterium]
MSDKKRILVIDDDPEILVLLKTYLETEGYEVIQSDNGAEGLEKAHSEMPDLIILDLVLPDIDGLKICRRLKSDNKYKNIPILVLSALDDQKHKMEGFESDADDYETKPFEKDGLIKRVKKLLTKKEA